MESDRPTEMPGSGFERVARAGATLFREGAAAVGLFILREGWAFRYKTLPDGRRQILTYLLPGDLAGFQAATLSWVDHGVETLTPVRYANYSLASLFADSFAQAGRDPVEAVAHLASLQERALDEHLLTLGRRSALERVAYIIWTLVQRLKSLGLERDGRVEFPLTQQHLADTLGLSLVHTNKTLRRLSGMDCLSWKGRTLVVRDGDRLAAIAGLAPA
ncbi:CRP/FNR family transcriptional regulator [Amorphus suaedae]